MKLIYLLKYQLITLLITIVVNPQSNQNHGTAGAQELLIPVGARGIALNSSVVSSVEGLESIYFNPAGLVKSVSKIDALFSQMFFIADIGVSFAAFSANFNNFGTIALSVKALDFGDITVTTAQQPYGTGETFSPSFIVGGFSYSNFFSDYLLFGFTTKIISEKIIKTDALGIAFDFGFQFRFNEFLKGTNMGIVIKNLGPDMKFDGSNLLRSAIDTNSLRNNQFYKIDPSFFELPLQIEFGISYESEFIENIKSAFSISYLKSNFQFDELKSGLEFYYDKILFIRAGFNFSALNKKQDEQIFGPSFGFGINVNTGLIIQLDYAYRWVNYFQPNQVFQIKIGF